MVYYRASSRILFLVRLLSGSVFVEVCAVARRRPLVVYLLRRKTPFRWFLLSFGPEYELELGVFYLTYDMLENFWLRTQNEFQLVIIICTHNLLIRERSGLTLSRGVL